MPFLFYGLSTDNKHIIPILKDPRFDTVLGLLNAGEITRFSDIFKWVSQALVAQHFKNNNNRVKARIADPSLWTLQDIYKLADLIGYGRKKLAMMAVVEVEEMRRG